LHIRLGASLKDFLDPNGEPALTHILKGISVDFKVNVWKKLSDLLMRIVGNVEVDASLLPILGGIAPALLMEINGNLDFIIDEKMKAKILENPLVEPALMPAPMLISAVSGKDYETEEEQWKDVSEKLPMPFSDLVILIAKHLGNEINFEVLDEYVGVKGRIEGEGLNKAVQNGLKFVCK